MLFKSVCRVCPAIHLGSSTDDKMVTTVEGASFFKVDTVAWQLTWIWTLYFLGLAVVICRLHVRRSFGILRAAKKRSHGAVVVDEATYALHAHAEIRCRVHLWSNCT